MNKKNHIRITNYLLLGGAIGMMLSITSCQGELLSPVYQKDKLVSYSTITCQDFWQLETRIFADTMAYWGDALGCVAFADEYVARRWVKQEPINDENWYAAFKQLLLAKPLQLSTWEYKRALTQVQLQQEKMPSGLYPIVKLWVECWQLNQALIAERVQWQKLKEKKQASDTYYQHELEKLTQQLKYLAAIENELLIRKSTQQAIQLQTTNQKSVGDGDIDLFSAQEEGTLPESVSP